MTANDSLLEQDLWEKWFNGQENEVANELVQHYMYLVTFHVERVAINLPKSVSKDDLKSFALIGLFDAMNKFERDRNLKFDTYASFRIRGSVIDGLRKEDWLPRSLRDKVKEIDAVSQRLEQTLQRPPTSFEIAEEIGITPNEVETVLRDSLFANVLSIDQSITDNQNEEADRISHTIPDESGITPDEQLITSEINEELIENIKLLNKNEQLVVSLFYHKELTMTEIGEVLDLTTSRISQIHKQSIVKLRRTLEKTQMVLK